MYFSAMCIDYDDIARLGSVKQRSGGGKLYKCVNISKTVGDTYNL